MERATFAVEIAGEVYLSREEIERLPHDEIFSRLTQGRMVSVEFPDDSGVEFGVELLPWPWEEDTLVRDRFTRSLRQPGEHQAPDCADLPPHDSCYWD